MGPSSMISLALFTEVDCFDFIEQGGIHKLEQFLSKERVEVGLRWAVLLLHAQHPDFACNLLPLLLPKGVEAILAAGVRLLH